MVGRIRINWTGSQKELYFGASRVPDHGLKDEDENSKMAVSA